MEAKLLPTEFEISGIHESKVEDRKEGTNQHMTNAVE